MVKENTHTQKHTQIFYFRRGEITVIFKVWQKKEQRNRGHVERNWSVHLYGHILHFYHSEGDRQHPAWQGWSSLDCSRTVTALWRGWIDCPVTQNTCCQGNYIFTHSIYFFHLYPLQPLFNYLFSHKNLIALCGLYATFPSISTSLLLSTDKLCIGPLCL